MHIHTSDVPAKELGEALSHEINTHDGDVVCLLSGGSALAVIDHINIADKTECLSTGTTASAHSRRMPPCGECRTIFMMGDERWSRERTVNNTLQLMTRYPDHFVTKHLIETVPEENESLENFATRMQKTFLEKISESKNVKIFMILGVGEDGHTAGIFPLPEGSFQETYRGDSTYVPVQVEGLRIDSRASFTPTWILDHVDLIFGYVVGEAKHAILESLVNTSKTLHERPAELMKLHKRTHLYTDIALP